MNYKRICDLSSDRYVKASKRARELGRGSQANRFAVAAGKALTNELRNFKFDITNKEDKELLQSVGIPASEFKNIDTDNDNQISTVDVIDWATLMGEPESIVEELKETVSEIVEESKAPESKNVGFQKEIESDLDLSAIYYSDFDITFLCVSGLPVDFLYGENTLSDFNEKIKEIEKKGVLEKESGSITCLSYFMDECARLAKFFESEGSTNQIAFTKKGDTYTYRYELYPGEIKTVTFKNFEDLNKQEFYFASSNEWLYEVEYCEELGLYFVFNRHYGFAPAFYVEECTKEDLLQLADEFDVMVGDIQSPQSTLTK